MVTFADELVSFDPGSYHWIPALNLKDLFCSSVERLHISRSNVPLGVRPESCGCGVPLRVRVALVSHVASRQGNT